METKTKSGYVKGFIPFAIAAGVLSLCGGFTAGVPAAIVAGWGGAYSLTTWITLAYSIGAAAMAPVLGKLGDVLGRRTTILLGLGLLTVGQLLISFGANLPFILVARFIVGCGAAAIAPVVMGYITTEFPPEKIAMGFSVYTLLACGTVVFGPTLGAFVMNAGGWKAIQYICTALGAVTFVICLLTVKKQTAAEKKSMAGFDYVGAVFVLIFFSMVLCVPTFGQNAGWGNVTTLVCMAVVVISLVCLFMVEKKAKSPVLNGKFMARKAFILPVIVLFLTQGLLQACMTNLIVFVRMTQPLNVAVSGYATSILYLGMAIGSILIGPLADKKEPRYIAAGAMVITLSGTAIQYLFKADSGFALFAASLGLIGIGLGGNASIFMKVALSGLAPEVAGSGTGTYNVFRDMAAPFGIALFVPMFTNGAEKVAAQLTAAGGDKAQAVLDGAVSAMHSTALVQVVCVALGIVVCFMLPKIYADKKA